MLAVLANYVLLRGENTSNVPNCNAQRRTHMDNTIRIGVDI